MRTLIRAVAVVAAASALLAGFAGAASASPSTASVSPGTAASTSTSPAPAVGARAFDRPPNIPAEALGPYNFVNRGTVNKCLDAFYSGGGVNGNPVGLWDCNRGITEEWYFRQSGIGYNWTIYNGRTGLCLEYPPASQGSNGWQYRLWSCDGSPEQRFSARDKGGWEFAVQLGGPNNVMDAFASDGGGNGNRVGNWSITNSPLQRWNLVAV